MPKRNIVQLTLPPEKPDCCATCPLVGLVPKHLRQHRSKETHVCLGTMEALTGRGIQVRASNLTAITHCADHVTTDGMRG